MSSILATEFTDSDNTVSETDDQTSLSPSKVRWFYKDEAAKKWIPFNGYDSIKIELSHLYLSKCRTRHPDEIDDSFKPLVVRDGLYEVDVVTKQCYPIYWEYGILFKPPAGSTSILRGIWFKDPAGPNSVPIEDESMVEQLEITYAMLQCRLSTTESIRSGSSSPKLGTDEESGTETTSAIGSIFSNPVKNFCELSVHTLKFSDCHVDWYSLDEVYLCMEGASFYIRQKLGMQKVGTRLGRGYFEEADLSNPPPVYSHLCFVVHGMGQKYLKGSIITACDGIRDTSKKLVESYFPDLHASERQVQFLPVEWRNSLRLDGNVVDSITLENLARLRTFLNCTFMDIMYYTSPLYRYEINQSLRLELNRLYCLFCERHPYFESNGGKVSILAHSLGCVISYDLITGWIEPVSYDQPLEQIQNSCESDENVDFSVLLAKLEAAKEVVKCLETQLERRKMNGYANGSSYDSHSLLFASRLENLFCMGSPLAVYLTLRGVRPGQTGAPDAIMPSYRLSENAYRLEPLLLKHYSSIPPVDIYRCTDASKFPYHTIHVINFISPKSSPPTQRRSTSGMFCFDTNSSATTESSTSLYKLPQIGAFMFGFFGRSTESEVTQPSPQLPPLPNSPPQVSAKRPKPSSPVSEPLGARFSVGCEEELMNLDTDDSVGFNIPSSPESETSSKIHLDYRMDYQLKESRYEAAYLSALTVHTGYWANADLMMFVLMQCYPDSTPLDTPLASVQL
ncbi:unnamed protein product [Hymenolepis diminuta]|uniref:DDHD domain-containing protein n=1 Tax=Hymenolepis diminuta TaxID=6216 RepID=A0A158QC59_HYMDI|nr:unnamed protein product [Hymenolepis diminuta]